MIELIVDTCNIPEEYLPRSTKAPALGFLQRHNTTEAQRVQGVSFLIAVARKASLSTKNHSDITTFSDATNCSRKFAKTVLDAIASGTENGLLKRNLRCDSIKATHWPNEISSFVLGPENSRAVPGQEGVSVRYGVRRPKYVFLDSKGKNIAQRFKEANPDCPFSTSLIAREFPQNAVSASKREGGEKHMPLPCERTSHP